MSAPRILCVSFSPLHRDSRVLRQLAVLQEFGEVTSVGYGDTPPHVHRHIEVPRKASSLPQTVAGVLRLALRMHRWTELKAPGEKAVLAETLNSGPYDLVVANDARALPLAFAAAGTAPVYADMHEWAMAENANSLVWRLLVSPYMDALCRRYLPRATAVTTVGGEIAKLYTERYGVDQPEVVRNAGPYQDLQPVPTHTDAVRLVHSGIAVPERNLEALIDATLALDAKFVLDLYLIMVGTSTYLDSLKSRAGGSERIRFCDPVPAVDLPRTLNRYDVGVYLLPVKSLNHRLMLPNKFFDFVQARIGVVFGPSVETDRLINQYGVGVVTQGWKTEDLVTTLRQLSHQDISRFKDAAHAAAVELSSESDVRVQRKVIARILTET